MRISTSQLYSQGVDAIERQQSEMLHTQQQVASGRRVLTPADDPIAAAQALTISRSKDQNDQYASNIDAAKSALALNDSVPPGRLGPVEGSIGRLDERSGACAGLDTRHVVHASDRVGRSRSAARD